MKRMTLAALSLTAMLSVAPAFADTASQDKTFVTDAGKGSLAEIQMAKLALKNSTNAEVRSFATKMIHDHTMLIQSMKPFATKMGVPAPTTLERAEKDEYDRLAGKKGESFDKDYITTAADDHKKDVADFTKEFDSTDNQALKAAVGKGRTVVEHHKEMIDALAAKYNLPVQK